VSHKQIDTARYRVKPGGRVRLRDHDPDDTRPFRSEEETAGLLEKSVKRMFEMTEVLYA
jgi:hypothetical protein